jgi:hypothetical protein
LRGDSIAERDNLFAMATAVEVLWIGAAGILLWVAGTVVFDTVHWLLHLMLRSRWAPLRALAWPHAIHHRWLDGELRTNWELQRLNVLCHLIPEYLTQLAFSTSLLLALPPAPVWTCIALQTLAFGYLLAHKGLDRNHLPVEILDAYRPSFFCPPAYHALHHVHPNGYFSAYTKLIDQLIGSAAWLAGRRYALHGAETEFGRALRAGLRAAGAGEVHAIERPADAARDDLDVLVLCDPGADPIAFVEAFARATLTRRLPPEVWALHSRAGDAVARHYARSVRVSYRVLFAPDSGALGASDARRVLSLVRRGAHFVPLCGAAAAWRAWRAFRGTRPLRPDSAPRVRSRLAAALGA